MPYVTVDGARLFYVQRSRGHRGLSLLLLHGAGGNALLWGPVLQHVAGIAAIAIDLPGHGRSPGPGRASIEEYGQVVLAAVDALGIERLALAGHSMGGAIALDLALHAPTRLSALILMSVTSRLLVSPNLLQQLVDDPSQARRWIIDTGYGPETLAEARRLGATQLAEVAPEVLHGDFVACSRYDIRSRLGEVRCPALVLCGAQDRLTPPRYVRSLQEGLPAAQFELIPGAGHMLPLECPEAVADALNRFLASQSAPTPPHPGTDHAQSDRDAAQQVTRGTPPEGGLDASAHTPATQALLRNPRHLHPPGYVISL